MNSSKTLLHGAYVQPDSLLDDYWIDLYRASDLISSKALSRQLRETIECLSSLVASFLGRPSLRVVNCCCRDTSLADRRFRPLRDWQPGSGAIRAQFAAYSAGYWTVGEWGGDALIISALANNWRAFDALMKNLSGRLDVVVFMPVFGPIGTRELDNFESPRGAPGYTLPLLVWDAASCTFMPGPASRRFAHLWEGLRRTAKGGQG